MTIAQYMNMIFAGAGLSQAEVARKLGVQPQNLNRKLTNGTVTVNDLLKIADTIGCKIEITFILPDGNRIKM